MHFILTGYKIFFFKIMLFTKKFLKKGIITYLNSANALLKIVQTTNK